MSPKDAMMSRAKPPSSQTGLSPLQVAAPCLGPANTVSHPVFQPVDTRIVFRAMNGSFGWIVWLVHEMTHSEMVPPFSSSVTVAEATTLALQ